MLGYFEPILGKIWTNPAWVKFINCIFLTQLLGLSIFDPKLG